MGVDISFMLPSNTMDRNPSDFVMKSIDNINNLAKLQNKYTYEILVYSKHKIEGENVKWFEEVNFSDGCVAAYNFLVNVSEGKWLVHSVDDCFFDEHLFSAFDLLESYVYDNRRIKILSLGSDNGLGSFMPKGYPKYGVHRYPIVGRETVMNYFGGYLYHPSFKNHYADNWLGYWLTYMFDETMVEVWNTTIHIGPPTSYNTYNEHDFSVFRELVDKFHKGYQQYA